MDRFSNKLVSIGMFNFLVMPLKKILKILVHLRLL